jgi:hypothetical protein
MVSRVPMSANEFIEQQLDERLKELEQTLKCDVLTFVGNIAGGVDDLVRNVIEEKRRVSQDRKKLAILLTTLGGYIEVVQRIVDTLRHHYKIVDFIVPNYAFSGGTVLAMSGDAIHMDYYSRLGPIDPQLERPDGRMVPALGYLIQWERLLKKARNSDITLPEVQLMIEGFDQAELFQYEQARELSVSLLQEWLVKYKFRNWKKTEGRGIRVTNKMRKERASSIARELSNTERWHTHGYGISMEVLRRNLKLVIDDFGQNPTLSEQIRQYHNLLDDYMTKMRQRGVLHTVSSYQPFLLEV